MPVFNVTVPDSSPLILYSGSWDDTPKSTTDYQLYQNQTYHLSSQRGDTATLAFSGSGIYIFGSRKPEYTDYTVLLDDRAPFTSSATASAAQYNTLLYSATSLDTTKEHQVVLVNSQGSLDVDYMIITAGDGNSQTTSQDVWWNQDNSKILYSANWSPLSGTNYTDHNAQWTYSQGAFATVMFEGNAIALYGATNVDHGLFNVSIDDGPESTFNGFAPEARFQMLLYYVNGLPSGKHTLRLVDTSPSSSQNRALELDTVSVSSWSYPHPNPASSASSQGAPVSGSTAGADGTSPTTTNTPPAHHVSTGKIVAGSVVVAVLGVVLVALGGFLLYRDRNRRRRRAGERRDILLQDPSPADPFYAPPRSSLAMQQMSERSVFTLPAPGAMSAYTLEGQSLSYTAPQGSSMTLVSASGAGMLEKQRLGGLYATSSPSTSSQFGSTPQVTDAPHDEDENPHRDFPPPGYGQVFPPSHEP